MCSMKRTFTREELLIEIDGVGVTGYACGLCEERGINEVHTTNCPLFDPDVLGVMVTTLSRPIKAICEDCGAMGKENCDWAEACHESLMLTCGRYAVETGRL